jgi:hypothetical protein
MEVKLHLMLGFGINIATLIMHPAYWEVTIMGCDALFASEIFLNFSLIRPITKLKIFLEQAMMTYNITRG